MRAPLGCVPQVHDVTTNRRMTRRRSLSFVIFPPVRFLASLERVAHFFLIRNAVTIGTYTYAYLFLFLYLYLYLYLCIGIGYEPYRRVSKAIRFAKRAAQNAGPWPKGFGRQTKKWPYVCPRPATTLTWLTGATSRWSNTRTTLCLLGTWRNTVHENGILHSS